VLFALSTYAKAGFDGVTKSRAVTRLSSSLDATALEVYAEQLMSAFVTGKLHLEGTIPLCLAVFLLPMQQNQ
jgi:hypothetical protein